MKRSMNFECVIHECQMPPGAGESPEVRLVGGIKPGWSTSKEIARGQ